MARAHAWLRVGACLCALTASRADAQPDPPPPPPDAALPDTTGARPWAAGVPAAEQAKALELYVAGNHEYTESHFAQALAKYKEAIQHWDHPAIRYNMAVCLINLDQPVEARADLERGLAYGAAPLGSTQYAQGLTYRKLLDAQLVHVKIACSEAGAEVTLDGKLVMTAPGATDAFLLPGTHQLVATKPGFLTTSRTFARVAGERATLEIEPALEPTLETHAVRRWATWKPWAVILGGGAFASVGVLPYLAARKNFDKYDRDLKILCPHGCDKPTFAKLTDLRHTGNVAEAEQIVAGTIVAVGGAAILAGVVGLILNQPRLQLAPTTTATVAWVPGGATFSMRWAL